jgi:hypothetical protein
MVLQTGGARITDQHDEKGRSYMLSKSFKKDGSPRKNGVLSEAQGKVLENLQHHLLVDFRYDSIGRVQAVYRAVAKDGTYFDYMGCQYEYIDYVSGVRSPRLRAVPV